MDDGSKKPYRESGLQIATHSFTYDDNLFICAPLALCARYEAPTAYPRGQILKNKYNLDVITRLDKFSKKGEPLSKLYFIAHSIPAFKSIISSFVISSMRYKL